MRSGFTIVRNGDSLGYPWKQSIKSLAPLVDEIVVAHGDSTDSTLESLRELGAELSCPLVIIDSPWDPANVVGGRELSRQTNVALKACRHEVCFYLQSDELLHEDDYGLLRGDLEKFENDPKADALALTWVHFYGNFDTVVHSKQWYRREIRVVKKSSGLKSYGDAQGFRIPYDSIKHWRKSRAALSKARCLHYGWVRPPEVMAKKSEALDRLWHGSKRDGTHKAENAYPPLYGMRKFKGTHPALMREWIEEFRAKSGDRDPLRGRKAPKDARFVRLFLTDMIERVSGWRPGEFKNYSSLKIY